MDYHLVKTGQLTIYARIFHITIQLQSTTN